MLRRGSRANPAGAPRAGRPGAVAKAAAAAGAAASAAARARCSTRSAAPAARTPRFPSSLAVIGPSTAATASSRSPAPAAAAVGTAVAAAATVVAAAAAVAAATAAVAAVATAAATVVVAAVAAIAAGSREAAGGSLLATSGREPPGLRHTRRTIRKGPTGNSRPGSFLLAWTCRLAGNRLAAVAHAFSNERRNVNWTRGGRPRRGATPPHRNKWHSFSGGTGGWCPFSRRVFRTASVPARATSASTRWKRTSRRSWLRSASRTARAS